MRISDWSSDVCSSDLGNRVETEAVRTGGGGQLHGGFHDLGLAFSGGFAKVQWSVLTFFCAVRSDRRLGGSSLQRAGQRSEERRVGKEGVSTCKTWWSPDH